MQSQRMQLGQQGTTGKIDKQLEWAYNFDSCRIIEISRPMYDTVKLLKALSHEHRLAIFERLRHQDLACDGGEGGCTVGEIAQQFNVSLSTVSHHLKELKEAGLIKCEQRGQHIYCKINEEAVSELRRYFSESR